MTPRALFAIVVIGSAGPVHAQTPAAEDAMVRAKAADDSARAHYEAREYADAIADYRRAYDALPDPLYTFDIAQAYRQLRDCANASAFYRKYLHALPTADNHAKVERFINEMDACAKQQGAPPPPVTEPTTDESSAPPLAPPSDHHQLRIAGVITTLSGLAIVGGGVYFSFEAADQASQLQRACASGCAGFAVVSIDRAGKDADHDAATLYLIGGAAAATGMTIFLWSMFHGNGEPPTITATRSGAILSTSVRF